MLMRLSANKNEALIYLFFLQLYEKSVKGVVELLRDSQPWFICHLQTDRAGGASTDEAEGRRPLVPGGDAQQGAD